MQAYLVRRLLGTAINLVLVSGFVFVLLQLLPGDLALEALGPNATLEQYEEFRSEHGLDRSMVQRYLDWSTSALSGDLGKSFRSGFSVTDDFLNKLPITLEIVIFSFFFTTLMGVAFGVISAARQDSVWDYGVRITSIAGLSIPNFLLLTLLLIFPARWFDYAPPFGAVHFFDSPWDNLRLFLPPSFLLSVGSSAGLMRLTRTAFLDVLRQDYMRTARAKGLSERAVLLRHAMRNAIAPVLTLMGIQLTGLLAGSIIVESVFGLQGLGLWSLQAIQSKDYPIVMAFSLYVAMLVMMISLVTDILYAVLDPRIRYT